MSDGSTPGQPGPQGPQGPGPQGPQAPNQPTPPEPQQPNPFNTMLNLNEPITLAQAMMLIAQQNQPQAPTTRNPKLHMKEPDVFDGKAQHARGFLMECDLYIQGNPLQFPSDTSKVLFMLSYCKEGSALNFREYVVNYVKNQGGVYPSYKDFVDTFKTAFVTSDDKGDALRELRELKQTGDVDTYIQKFKMLLTRAQISDFETQKSYFVGGLSKFWTDRLGWQTQLPEDNMEAWYKTVQHLDQNHRYILSVKGGGSGGTYIPTKTLPQGEPMDIDAVRLDKEEREKRMRERRCFKCNKTGHIAANCFSRQGSDNNQRYNRDNNNNNQRFNGNNNQRYNRDNNRQLNGSQNQGNRVAQIRSLLKDLNPDERGQIMSELRGNSMVRIRALMQGLPEEDKEQLAEEAIADEGASSAQNEDFP